jgi:hypothetical protein
MGMVLKGHGLSRAVKKLTMGAAGVLMTYVLALVASPLAGQQAAPQPATAETTQQPGAGAQVHISSWH